MEKGALFWFWKVIIDNSLSSGSFLVEKKMYLNVGATIYLNVIFYPS